MRCAGNNNKLKAHICFPRRHNLRYTNCNFQRRQTYFICPRTRSADLGQASPRSSNHEIYVIRTRWGKISVLLDMFCRQEWPLRINDGEIILAAYANYYGPMYWKLRYWVFLGARNQVAHSIMTARSSVWMTG